MTPSICLDPLYPSLLTEDKIPRVAAAGFRHVEFWSWRDKDIPAIEAACRKHDVHVVNFSGHRMGSPVADATHPILFADASDAVATARILSCQRLMLLTNALNPDGSVADRFEEIPDEIKFKRGNTSAVVRSGVFMEDKAGLLSQHVWRSIDSRCDLRFYRQKERTLLPHSELKLNFELQAGPKRAFSGQAAGGGRLTVSAPLLLKWRRPGEPGCRSPLSPSPLYSLACRYLPSLPVRCRTRKP